MRKLISVADSLIKKFSIDILNVGIDLIYFKLSKLSQQQLNVRMKLRQSKQFQLQDTPPVQEKARHVRYDENTNDDNGNFVIKFRRRGRDNQLYHSQEFIKPQTQKSLMCNEVYDNNDFFKQSFNNQRNLRKGWVLTQSQENLLEQKKPRLDSSINFRSMRPQNQLLTKSREFLEEKQIINEAIDDLIKKNQKSVQEYSRSNEVIMCSNQDGKKAKYRMEDPDEELYYCSKCSIMLLQKGFQISQIEQSSKNKIKPKSINAQKYKQEFNGLSFKIRCLKESLKNAIQSVETSFIDSRLENEQIKINDVYQLIISVADSMRKKDLAQLKQNFQGINHQKNKTKSSYYEKYTELENLQAQVDDVNLNLIDEDNAKFMLTNFNKTVDILQQEPSRYQMTVLEESLQSRLDRLVASVKDHWPKGSIQFSFEKSERFDVGTKDIKQPFRHLFTDDDEIKPSGFGGLGKPFKEPNSHNFLKTRNI